jgi:single-stranded-DNA-specific exonuclease
MPQPNRPRPPSPRSNLPRPTASEAAFERLLASFPAARDAEPQPGSLPEPVNPAAAAILDDLFARRDALLAREPFARIGEADEFNTKIVGVSFEGRQSVIAGLAPGDRLELERRPENPFDANAIAVCYGDLQLGFLRREIALRIAPLIDAGERYTAVVTDVTGGRDGKNVGTNIRVRRARDPLALRRSAGTRQPAERDDLRRALIGSGVLRPAQHEVLERVAAGGNTLAVMGTGRGKSLCFQLPAAQRALERGEKTLVLYPLRALANDQFESFTRRLGGFGLRILRANGSIEAAERETLDEALADGSWDVILATPEFTQHHRAAFTLAHNRPSLLVVDEAHHVHESRHRAAYAALGGFVAELGDPQVLALTATANEDAFRGIRDALRITQWVIDPTVRENLRVVDARGTRDKLEYIARGLDPNGKAIVYCNSRDQATKLAEGLRRSLGNIAAFYHAGLSSADRANVETLFRAGDVRIVAATSAFGEGIDLPDVRDVFLYHLNFDVTEFNQQAGRVGRDGAPARIHLLFGEADRSLNDFIIARAAPTLPTLRELYREMKKLAMFDVLRMALADVARTLEIKGVEAETVGAAVRIFEEAGLVQTGNDDDGRYIRFLEVRERVDVTATTRYAEAEAERESFDRFCKLALGTSALQLEQIVNRPIYPDGIPILV